MTTDTESRSLWLEYRRTHDKVVRDRLIVTYSPLVKYVAGRLGSGLPAHVEEADRYMQVLAQFLSRVEAQT